MILTNERIVNLRFFSGSIEADFDNLLFVVNVCNLTKKSEQVRVQAYEGLLHFQRV